MSGKRSKSRQDFVYDRRPDKRKETVEKYTGIMKKVEASDKTKRQLYNFDIFQRRFLLCV